MDHGRKHRSRAAGRGDTYSRSSSISSSWIFGSLDETNSEQVNSEHYKHVYVCVCVREHPLWSQMLSHPQISYHTKGTQNRLVEGFITGTLCVLCVWDLLILTVLFFIFELCYDLYGMLFLQLSDGQLCSPSRQTLCHTSCLHAFLL